MEETQKKLMDVVESLGTAKFGVPEVKMADIIARLDVKDESLVLLDIRSEEETAVSTIPGSVSKATFDANPDKYAGKSKVKLNKTATFMLFV